MASFGEFLTWLIRGGVRKTRRELIPGLTAPVRFLRSPRQLITIWPGEQADLGPKVAIVAHFHRRGAVHEHVARYLASLAEAGLSVVLVSNSGRLTAEAKATLRPLCAAVLIRRNIGYDFGAWREAIEHFGLPRPDTEMLVLANDSVYGPLQPLRETLDRIRLEEAPVWGLTESWQTGYHLQSYFLAFGPRALQSEAWAQFWKRVRPAPSKHWVIRQYEVGLTQAMIRGGFDCKAVWPYDSLIGDLDPALFVQSEEDDREREDPLIEARMKHANIIRSASVRRVPLNPTSDLWRQLLRNKYPFIKRELLRDNPTMIADISEWQAIVSETGAADLGAILLDLKRTLRNRAP
jgi:lipopolysaccharide biosynthesis protein